MFRRHYSNQSSRKVLLIIEIHLQRRVKSDEKITELRIKILLNPQTLIMVMFTGYNFQTLTEHIPNHQRIHLNNVIAKGDRKQKKNAK